MPNTIAKSATDDLLPLTIGRLSLAGGPVETITAVAAWPGAVAAADARLRRAGLGWPRPDRAVVGKKGGICLWSGRDQVFVIGAAPPAGLGADAALTDVTDGWVALDLSGPGAAEALQRLVPIDLSPRAFPSGATARTGLGHMMTLVYRPSDDLFRLYVFRSMTAHAVHEIEQVMKAMAARAAI